MNANAASNEDLHLTPDEVEARLAELDAIQSGHFKLSSGLHSDRYFQCARVLQYPGLARELGRLLGERFDELQIDFVISPAAGGVVLGHEVARALGRRHIFAERREGGFSIRRGFEIKKGERGLVVDDVLTRGTSFAEMTELIASHEAALVGLGVIVDRREPDVVLDSLVHSLLAIEVKTYEPDSCPLCREGTPLNSPGSRHAG
jgi:orotate phosphoribosyltransferase